MSVNGGVVNRGFRWVEDSVGFPVGDAEKLEKSFHEVVSRVRSLDVS